MTRGASIRVTLGGLLALVVLVPGCGGGDESSDSDEPAAAEDSAAAPEPDVVTKKEFIKEADAICKTGQQDFAKLLNEEADAQAKAQAPETLASEEAVRKAADEVAKVTDDIADVQARATQALKKVEAPPGEDILEKWIKFRAAANADIRKLADAWRAYGKSPTQETVDAVAAASAQQQESAATSRKFVEDYGFKQCGEVVKPA